jgi:hypothetical protein
MATSLIPSLITSLLGLTTLVDRIFVIHSNVFADRRDQRGRRLDSVCRFICGSGARIVTRFAIEYLGDADAANYIGIDTFSVVSGVRRPFPSPPLGP